MMQIDRDGVAGSLLHLNLDPVSPVIRYFEGEADVLSLVEQGADFPVHHDSGVLPTVAWTVAPVFRVEVGLELPDVRYRDRRGLPEQKGKKRLVGRQCGRILIEERLLE